MGELEIISGVAADHSEAMVTIRSAPDRPGVAAAIFRAVAAQGLSVDLIAQARSSDDRADISFLVPKDELDRLEPAAKELVAAISADTYEADADVAKVSLVGAGIKAHPEVLADMFEALAEEGINVELIAAAPRGQPGPFVALALVLFALILGRRLEGVGAVVRAGVRPAQALWYRVVFDSSGPPRRGTSGSP